MARKKGKFGKFCPQKKRRNMDKVRCYGFQELGHYKEIVLSVVRTRGIGNKPTLLKK